MIGNHLVHNMVGNQPSGLQRSVRLLELGPTPLESRIVLYHANISILIVNLVLQQLDHGVNGGAHDARHLLHLGCTECWC